MEPKNKIIVLYDFLKELGGLERVMVFQANILKKHYSPELVFGYVSNKQKNKILKELELNKGIKVFQLKKGKGEIRRLISTFLNKNSLEKTNPNLIISHSFMASKIAYKKKKKHKTKYIVMIHHPPNFLYGPSKGWTNNPARLFARMLGIFLGKILRKIDIKSVRGSELIITNSKYTAKRVKQIYNKESEVVYPPVSDFFKIMNNEEIDKFKQEKNINKPFIYTHGRIIPDKNYELALDIIEKFPNLNLIISGTISPEYLIKFKNLIKKRGLENRVKILGRIPLQDLLGYYNCAELFLMTAPKEDFGITTVEAMSCGCPVIAWNDGAGPSEVIIKKNNGLMANAYDLNDYVEKVGQGLKMKWEKEKISNSVKKFSKQEIEKSFLKIIKKV